MYLVVEKLMLNMLIIANSFKYFITKVYFLNKCIFEVSKLPISA